MADLSSSVGGIPLVSCVYNASGPRTGSSAALSKIAASSAGAILTKSATLEAQNGNPQPRTWHAEDNKASMNSEGLPNSGIDYYIDSTTIQETLEACPNGTKKPYLVSISGKTLQDNLEMLDRIAKKISEGEPIAGVELNLACPNVIGKPIIAYDFDQMKDILSTISNKKHKFILGLKLPPYLDSKHLQQAAAIINDYSTLVSYVVCINTIGNALSVDEVSEAPFISSNNGLAGLSGPAVKYTALANVRQMRQQLKSEIDVVGVGGIETGTDAFLFLLCGASAVQVGTCHWKEGPQCFDRICTELQQLLNEKGYTSVQDCIGKLKSWSKEGAALTRAAKKQKQQQHSTVTTEKSDPGYAGGMKCMIDFVLVVVIAILLGEKFKLLSIPE
ncbi:dihydroorotate dehydrogenase 1A [Nitzschia inconspicua]|uniref:Dihydroorotate dehydrogenase 1A n=1 Tax=Nitzschia inconspicua TaxID=303405 RepID=A0A9K3PN32_9STRA|nr:dihydroorotate dehydrogenase 1A [Nitzschia inconspicua]